MAQRSPIPIPRKLANHAYQIESIFKLPHGGYGIFLEPGWRYGHMHYFSRPTQIDALTALKKSVERCDCPACRADITNIIDIDGAEYRIGRQGEP